MEVIKHQIQNESIPKWEIKHLLVGTFNPSGGEPVNYYYGRDKNQAWKLISHIFCDDFNPNSESFLELLKKHKIACIDMINNVKAANERLDRIIGKGYKDSEIINKSVKRDYNTENIKRIIDQNPEVRVYSTWGKGSNLKEWKKEIEKLGPLVSLVSPSLAAKVPRGKSKFAYMLSDWKKKINN